MLVLLTSGYSGVVSVLKLIGLIIVCIIIIAASSYTTRFIGQKQMGNVGESNFKSVDVYRINQNKYLQIVQVGKKYFVIAVCKDTVTMLGELSEDDITFKKNIQKRSFKEILSKVSNNKENADEDNGILTEDEAEENGLDINEESFPESQNPEDSENAEE